MALVRSCLWFVLVKGLVHAHYLYCIKNAQIYLGRLCLFLMCCLVVSRRQSQVGLECWCDRFSLMKMNLATSL